MAKLTHLMWHCSDTPAGKWFDGEDIKQWHLKENGWSRVGYSVLFLLNGEMEVLIPFDKDDEVDPWEISNGAKGWNGVTRHACYIGGGKGRDTRTPEQIAAMATFAKFHAMIWPNVKNIGHNQVSSKYCPSYDVPAWGKQIGLPSTCIDFNQYT